MASMMMVATLSSLISFSRGVGSWLSSSMRTDSVSREMRKRRTSSSNRSRPGGRGHRTGSVLGPGVRSPCGPPRTPSDPLRPRNATSAVLRGRVLLSSGGGADTTGGGAWRGTGPQDLRGPQGPSGALRGPPGPAVALQRICPPSDGPEGLSQMSPRTFR